jgi:hypothetical protein
MSGRMAVLGLICLLPLGSCTGGEGAATTVTPTTASETTTSSFENPFVDLVEEPSNFAGGAVIDVVGLSLAEQNWVSSFPADDVEFFGYLWQFDRLNADLVAVGEAASYQDGPPWEKVQQPGREIGFVPRENTGVVGAMEVITNQVAGMTSASVDDLVESVAESIGSSQGLEPIQITQREFGGREVYYDLVGGDDPLVRGFRLHIVVGEDGESFVPTLVEQSIICVSGTDAAGMCF